MQHTALPTMHQPSSVTHRHAHSPRSGREPGPHRGRFGADPSSMHLPGSCTGRGTALAPAGGLGPCRGRPRRATPGRVQPALNKGCAQAAGAACIPAPRPGGGGGGAGAQAAAVPARSALPALRALGLPRSGSLLPATAAAVRLPHRTHQLFIARLQLPRRSQSQAEAQLMGPPPPRRQPAARPGASDSPPGMGMGRGRAGGGGALSAPAKLPTARALRRVLGPRRRDHPPCVCPRGAGGSGEAGRAAAGGGEGGGAREEDERLADLLRRLQGAPARARPPRPASLAARTPAPSPHLLSRRPPAQPLCCEGERASTNRRQLTFQTCTQGWCCCTPPRSERTARPAALQPPGGGGDQAPFPPPPGQLIESNTCASGAPGALSPEGAAGKALPVDDFGCLPPPANLPKWSR